MSDIVEKIVATEIKKILKEIADNKKIKYYVFDFDDTLVSTNSKIFVIDQDTGETTELTSYEFHHYNLKGNERLDLSQFKEIIEPEYLPTFKLFDVYYSKYGPSNVAVCTARPHAKPVEDFLNNLGYNGVEIAAVGTDLTNSKTTVPKRGVIKRDAGKKKNWIENKIKEKGIDYLEFYDDNMQNINSVKQLKKTFPEVEFKIVHT